MTPDSSANGIAISMLDDFKNRGRVRLYQMFLELG